MNPMNETNEQNYRILFSEEEIQHRIKELGAQITMDYEGKAPVLIGLLKGSFLFIADLARQIKQPCELEFILSSTYGNSTERIKPIGDEVQLPEIKGKDVLVVEDIIDTGLSLSELVGKLLTLHPASLRIVALLDKQRETPAPVHADYVGFPCPDEFVVGYGMDRAQRLRNLPFIGVPKGS